MLPRSLCLILGARGKEIKAVTIVISGSELGNAVVLVKIDGTEAVENIRVELVVAPPLDEDGEIGGDPFLRA